MLHYSVSHNPKDSNDVVLCWIVSDQLASIFNLATQSFHRSFDVFDVIGIDESAVDLSTARLQQFAVFRIILITSLADLFRQVENYFGPVGFVKVSDICD